MVTPQFSRKMRETSLPKTLEECYQSTMCTLTTSAYDAVSMQQKDNIAYQTATVAAVSTLFSGEAARFPSISSMNLTDGILESHIEQLSCQIQKLNALQQIRNRERIDG